MLAGSTSVTCTIASQLQLRMISFLGMALVVIWTLSPIGGQASFRQMTIGPRISTKPASFTYMTTSNLLQTYTDLATSANILRHYQRPIPNRRWPR